MPTPTAPPGPPPGPPPPPPSGPPAPTRPGLPAADLERRYYAHVVDRGLAWASYAAVAALAGWLLDDPLVGLLVVLGWVLVVQVGLAVLLGLRGLSPGKALLGMRTVSERTGRPVGVGPALLRGLVVGLAGLPTLLLGAATLAWTSACDHDRRRRGWHDHLAGTLVVDVRPAPQPVEVDGARPAAIVNLTAMRLVPAPARPTTTTPPAARPPAPAAPAANGWVVEVDSGERIDVEGLVLLGRGPVARTGEQVRHLVPLRSPDMSVSKTHAQLQVAPDGALVVMDRGSTNGSVVVRSGVPRELAAGTPVTLLDGDVVRLGDRTLRVGRTGRTSRSSLR